MSDNSENVLDLFDENDEIPNEEVVFGAIGNIVVEINELTDKTSNLLKHFNIQTILLCLMLLYGVPTIFSIITIIVMVVTFGKSSNVYVKRKDELNMLNLMISFYRKEGVINDENKNKLKEFNLKSLWFEN